MTHCLSTWITKGLGKNNLHHRCDYQIGHGGPCLCLCERPGLFNQIISYRSPRRTLDADSNTQIQPSTGRA